MKNYTANELTSKNLWDTEWLEEKYPEAFKDRNKQFVKKADNKYYKK